MNKKGFILSFLICLFSFYFITCVNAQDVTIENANVSNIDFSFNGVTYNYEKIKNDINTQLSGCGKTLEDFDNFILRVPSKPSTSSTGNNGYYRSMQLYLFNAEVTGYSFRDKLSASGVFKRDPFSSNYLVISWNFSTNNVGSNCSVTGTMSNFNGESSTKYFNYYSNVNWHNIDNMTSEQTYPVYSKLLIDNSLLNTMPTIFNFHLNGGHASTNLIGFIPHLLFNDSEFSFSTDDGDFETFLTSLNIEKDNMIFDGFYYDFNFTQPLKLNDNFDDYATVIDDQKVINLYAKYRYENASDFLNNTSFNSYTFDINHDYAIINRGNNFNSIYIGLPISTYSLEIYEYDESNNTVKNGASACLVPIFSNNGYYYYELNTLFTSNQEVLLLPKSIFNLDNYNFYLTDNAYISYTDDLSSSVIVDSNGNNVTINLQDSFETSQYYQETYSSNNSLKLKFKNSFSRFINPIKFIFKNVTNLYNNYINSSMQHYFFLVFSLMLIILIIRVIF